MKKIFIGLVLSFVGCVALASPKDDICQQQVYYFNNLVSQDGRLVTAVGGAVFMYNPSDKVTECFIYRPSWGARDGVYDAIILQDGRLAVLDADPVYKLYIVNLVSKKVETTIVTHQLWDRLLETSDHRILTSHGYKKAAVFNLQTGQMENDAYLNWDPATAVAIPGRVLFFSFGRVVGQYVEKTNSFVDGEEQSTDSHDFTVARLLSNRKIILVGGRGMNQSFLYDPKKNAITKTFETSNWFNGFQVTELPGQRVLVSGGQPGVGAPSTMRKETILINVRTGKVTKGPSMTAARKDHVFIPTKDGNFIVSGGFRLQYSSQPPPPFSEFFDVKKLEFKPLQ